MIVLLWIFFAIIVAAWAKSWERSFGLYLFAAILFSPVLAAISLLISGKDGKECPSCKETIKVKAIKCRFCGQALTENTNKDSI